MVLLLTFVLIFALLFTGLAKWWEIFPLLIEKSLKFTTSYVHRRSRGIEKETIANHQLEVIIKLLSRWIFLVVEFLANGCQVHGLLDDPGISRNPHRDPI
jgi:hypothetical protein